MARRRGDGRSDRQQDERPEVGQSEDTGVPGGGKPASEASDDPASATGRAAPDPDPDPIPPASEGGERLARARELVREGRIEEAIAQYREIVTDHPESLKARNNLGLLYDGLGHHERALEQFEAARALDPENVEVLSNVGSALIGMGRFDEAERELRRGMKLEPDNVEVRAHLGILYFRRGLYAQADTELRWVCGRDEEHGPAHFYRGEALNRMGKVDMAIEVMERAARIQPMNPRIYQTLGILYDRKHMPAEAAQMYRKVRELSR